MRQYVKARFHQFDIDKNCQKRREAVPINLRPWLDLANKSATFFSIFVGPVTRKTRASGDWPLISIVIGTKAQVMAAKSFERKNSQSNEIIFTEITSIMFIHPAEICTMFN